MYSIPAFMHGLLRRLVDVRREETGAALFAFAYFFCLLSSYYLLRPLRDAMGLVGGAGQLKWLFTATFIAMLALVPVFGAIATRWPPRKFVPVIYRFFALNMLGFGILFANGFQEIAVSRVFFVWISVYNLFVVSIFWSVLADCFRNKQGRRLYGFIAAGGTLGALIGPALAASLVVKFGVAILTVLAALLLELAVRCFRQLHDATHAAGANEPHAAGPAIPDKTIGGGLFAGIVLILRERYLLAIVVYMLLQTFMATFLYFEQGRIVAASLADTASRTQLFATADLAVSCLTIVLQFFVTARFIRYFGLAAAMALLPVAAVIAFTAIALWPTLFALVAAQSIRRASEYAIARPGREVLFTVVSREAKYKAKSVIETVVYRGGDALGGWLFALVAAAGAGIAGLALLSLPLAAVSVWLSAWLARRQETLAASQEAGRSTSAPAEPAPATAAENRSM